MKNALLALCLALLPFSALAKFDAYKIDTSASKATWEGTKLVGKHQGELKVKGGELQLEKGALTGGNVEIDMTSLTDKDLTDAKSNNDLVTHLKSPDFFSVAEHPVSALKITKVEKKDGKMMVTGDLTIKGITKPITFPVDFKSDKKGVSAKGEMTVDRTLYDIKFRSLKFFSNIGDKVISDNFKVGFDVAASK